MPRDFAKHERATRASRARRASTGKQSAKRRADHGQGGGWRLYLGGVATGVFLSFLGYLAMLPGPADTARDQKASTQPEKPVPKPRFDFYTLLPEQTIGTDFDGTVVEPAADVGKPQAGTSEELYLQAGSFRQRDDADQRRAELLLLGLEPSIKEAVSDNGRWFRVYLGPFESHAAMSKARGLTANQNIDTLLLKRRDP